ncbi:excinuclease ABC subunit A [Palleronia sp. KMU-117]|uniref:excinuclease ABC subunit A n=1 Tax=Palleronia sp. KMU-117 TaxID=3434108 RepID=UPI003D761209
MTRQIVTVLALLLTVSGWGAAAAPNGCPPGLAKKDPPCVPPGLAKQGVDTDDRLRRGDYYDRDYDRIRDWDAYDLPSIGGNEGYYRNGRIVYRVDERTRRVLDWIELTDEILRN